MQKIIHELIYIIDIDNSDIGETELLVYIDELAKQAFVNKDSRAQLEAQQILYQLNLAHLAVSWELPAKNLSHPVIAAIKYKLERSWEQSERQKHHAVLQNLPVVENFPDWIKKQFEFHASNQLHPIFTFLRDTATFEQMREFFFQETPLEMLFGDILAFMLPGVYGSIKIEFLKNYWDEVGNAKDDRVHRNLRAKLMKAIQIHSDCYIKNYELFICEELELINLYLSLATQRAKHSELAGVMLATELMIPNRFKYSIKGWQRFNLEDDLLEYLIEHTSIDEVHAENWLTRVIMPIMQQQPRSVPDIVFGVLRRLDLSMAVLNRLYDKLQNTKVSSLGKFCHAEEVHVELN